MLTKKMLCLSLATLSTALLCSVAAAANTELSPQLQGEMYASKGHRLICTNADGNFLKLPIVSAVSKAYAALNSKEAGGEIVVQDGEKQVKYVYSLLGPAIALGHTESGSVYLLHSERLHSIKPKDSLGGIRPFMTFDEVTKVLGAPNSRKDVTNAVEVNLERNRKNDGFYYHGDYLVHATETWHYDKGNMDVTFRNGIVYRIVVPMGSNIRFSKSGLKAVYAPDKFTAKYGVQPITYDNKTFFYRLKDGLKDYNHYSSTAIFLTPEKLEYLLDDRD